MIPQFVTLRPFRAPPLVGEEPLRPAPTFSVVVAAHNAAETLSDAVESALAQTLPPLELIVCDDGSTDDTAAVVEPYRDRLTYLRKERGGVASARNAALAIAKGEFLAVLDADDAYLPDRLEALAELGSARPDLDLLCTDAFFELDGRVVGTFSETCPFEVVDQRAAILERCFCVAPAIRRTTLLRVGGFDESLRTGSDWECVIRIIHAGGAAGLVDEALYRYRYRVDGASLTADRVGTLQDRVSFLERVARTYDLRESERATLASSLTAQRASLVLTEAEAALRARASDARSRAFAAARSPGVAFRSRAAALAAGLAPRTAARTLERRARGGGSSRLGRSLPRE
jgi:hypothetical protein